MTHLTLFGTTTSPYVRRVRVVAHELGIGTELVDTARDAGQEQLRDLSPIWKVPAARIDGVELFDSSLITQHLMKRFGTKTLAPFDPADVVVRNFIAVIDGALDALINGLYLARDGISAEQASYVAKQSARAASAMAWIEAKIPCEQLGQGDRFGLAELALYTCVDWMRFRKTYDPDRHPNIVRFVSQHAARGSLVATKPA